MAVFVKRSRNLFSHRGETYVHSQFEGAIPNEQRDARRMAATMDHSNIRGLGTAFDLFFAGLPRSDSEIISFEMLAQKIQGFPSSILRIALPVEYHVCRKMVRQLAPRIKGKEFKELLSQLF